MKSIEVIVEKSLVKKHYPHPEYYGESIVELLNGLITDVYTNEDGELFTITNEEEIIDYLKESKTKDQQVLIQNNNLKLRTIHNKDLNLVLSWMNQLTNYSYNETKYEEDDIRVFISHSITQHSHRFIIENDNISVGVCGYILIDNIAHVDIEIYEKEIMSSKINDIVLKVFINFINELHSPKWFYAQVFEDDIYSIELLKRNNFMVLKNKRLEVAVSETSSKYEIILKLKTNN